MEEKTVVEEKKEYKTNRAFAKDIIPFLDACEAVGIAPTPRQASKYRMGKGAARSGTPVPKKGGRYDKRGKDHKAMTLRKRARKAATQ